MKIYRLKTIASSLRFDQARRFEMNNPGSYLVLVKPLLTLSCYDVVIRKKFIREQHLEGKALLKMLPAWAKAKHPPTIGHKVTAFYAENAKVVCDLSKPVVGSPEYF